MVFKKQIFPGLRGVLLLLLFWPVLLQAQTQKERDTRLVNGKQLLSQGKNELALAELAPLIQAPTPYEQKPLALYLYSVAALRVGKTEAAAQHISQLLNQYPAWPNSHEARYLEANIAFEQKDYAKALKALAEIKGAALEADIAAMKHTYLSRINDKTLLENLLRSFPNDRDLAVVYANKLMAGWYTDKDKATLESLVSRFDLDRSKYVARPEQKKDFKVALLLPFPLDETDDEVLRKHKPFIDLYTGILMAKDSLARQGIQLALYNYQAPADTNQIKAILSLPELATMDLIIGPVYKSATKIISRFAEQHQIVAINPLSNDINLVKNNPYLFLFQSSITTRARNSARFAYENFPVKTALVVYTNSEDHILFARTYKAEYEKLGGKVLRMKPVSPSSTGAGIYADVDFSAVGHLLVASNHTGLAYNTVSNLERLPEKIPVLTYGSWLEISQLSLEQLDRQEIYFLYPEFVDTTLETVRAFKKQYTARFQVPPSHYAYAGFDLMYYFGNILARHGARFHTRLNTEGAISGVFLQGIGYAGEHDNQYVPILKLDNLELTVVNPVFK